MHIQFSKYQGAGNDFVMIDNRDRSFVPETGLIQHLCDRHFGIGADGLILLEEDPAHDFSMRYYNSDGNEGTMCGNGGRCIAWFAYNLGVMKNEGIFNAIDGVHHAQVLKNTGAEAIVKLQMKDVQKVIRKENAQIIDSGSPHLVVHVDDVENIDVFTEGRNLRNSPAHIAEGINVNFINLENGIVHIRTYERGVENETLACGTGAVASAIAVMDQNPEISSPVSLKAKGGDLKVYLEKSGHKYANIWLEGPAKVVFEGSAKTGL